MIGEYPGGYPCPEEFGYPPQHPGEYLPQPYAAADYWGRVPQLDAEIRDIEGLHQRESGLRVNRLGRTLEGLYSVRDAANALQARLAHSRLQDMRQDGQLATGLALGTHSGQLRGHALWENFDQARRW